jgi:hypothetical protein
MVDIKPPLWTARNAGRCMGAVRVNLSVADPILVRPGQNRTRRTRSIDQQRASQRTIEQDALAIENHT